VLAPADTCGVFIKVMGGDKLEVRDVELSMEGQKVGVLVQGGELCLKDVVMTGAEVGVKVDGLGTWSLKDCKVRGAGVAVMVGENTKGGIDSCVIEGNMIGLSVVEGAQVDIKSSYVGKNKEQGLLVRCQESQDLFKADEALKEAEEMGIKVRDSEIAFNQLGDVILTETNAIESFVLSCTKHEMSIAQRRFSTPNPGSATPTLSMHRNFFSGDKQDGSPACN